ncbi:RNA-directed DNA polymerase, eukaryota [Tanacetum coccineum]
MPARGMSGGIICLWNDLVFRKSSIVCNENYVVVKGIWIPYDVRIMWIAVYAPQSLHSKIALWSSLTNLIANWDGIWLRWVIFNMVREAGERFGSIFNERHAELFNAFILNASLIDVPLGGYKFTWTDKWGSKMSKLDRFLVSKSFYDTFPHITGVVLEKGSPDHRPILLREHSIDQGNANDLDLLNRLVSIRILRDLNRLEASDLAQKARIKWVMEGDENTSFFHATLKKNHRQLAIKGILNDGEWIEYPDSVKVVFREHFRNRSFPKGCNSSFIALIPKVSNATLATDFCPISLIGCQYKIIGKNLAKRLGMVIGSCMMSTWMAFGGNTRDLGSFGEETNEITDLHQILEKVLLTERGDGVACIKRRRRDPSSDGVRDLVTASERSRLNEDLESST